MSWRSPTSFEKDILGWVEDELARRGKSPAFAKEILAKIIGRGLTISSSEVIKALDEAGK